MKDIAKDYTFSFESAETPEAIFEILIDPRKWWIGFYGEEIKGSSKTIGDSFSFHAGGGVHYSKQQLIELVPEEKITWQVTESNLSFLTKTDEWVNTKISFEISKQGNKTLVTFTHHGLVPKIECYGDCSAGWTKYLKNLAHKLA